MGTLLDSDAIFNGNCCSMERGACCRGAGEKFRICVSVRVLVETMYCGGGARKRKSVAYDFDSVG